VATHAATGIGFGTPFQGFADWATRFPGLELERPFVGAWLHGSVLVRFADMVLRVEFEAQPGDKFKLGLEKIDVFFLVPH